jgi:peroxiredoxin Q/BCP
MTRFPYALRLAAVAVLAVAAPAARAQQPAPAAPPADVGPKVGDVAPDFSFAGITRYGALQSPIRLSQLQGNTVVLAFFPAARTKG